MNLLSATDAVERITHQLLIDAHIAEANYILDAGCGYGRVTAKIGAMAKPNADITAWDHDEHNLHEAEKRLTDLGYHNIAFHLHDLNDLAQSQTQLTERFDVIFLRRVLMYLKDPGSTLAKLHTLLNPGGRIIIQEHSQTGLSNGAMPMHQLAHDMIWQTVAKEGGNVRLGPLLPGMLEQTGYELCQLSAHQILETRSLPWQTEHLFSYMIPRMEANQIEPPEGLNFRAMQNQMEIERNNLKGFNDLGEVVWAMIAQKTML